MRDLAALEAWRFTYVAAEVEFDRKWIHAETILARAQLGEMHTHVPKELNGKWRMS